MNKETKHTIIRTCVFLSVLLLLLAGLGAVKYRQIQNVMAMMNASGPPPVTVEAITAETEEWRPYVVAVGTLTAREGIHVTAEVEGVIEEIHFQSGHRVNKGDLLVTLNDDVEQADLENLLVQLDLAGKVYSRSESMLQKRAISENEYDEARSKVKIIEANIASTRARIAKKYIRAPFTGVLGITEVNTGEYVAPGKELVSLQDYSVLFADFSVPEKFLPDIRTGLTIEIRTSAYPERVFTGEVVATEAMVDESTRNIHIRASLPNDENLLLPGMYADIKLILDKTNSMIIVPSTALVFSSFGDALYTVEQGPQGGLVARYTAVTVGEQRNNRVAILSGLSGGQRVVSAGVSKLRNGAAVVISTDPRLQEQQ